MIPVSAGAGGVVLRLVLVLVLVLVLDKDKEEDVILMLFSNLNASAADEASQSYSRVPFMPYRSWCRLAVQRPVTTSDHAYSRALLLRWLNEFQINVGK